MEVGKRLLLNGVRVDGADIPIREDVKASIKVDSCPAITSLPVLYFTASLTNAALNRIVLSLFVVTGFSDTGTSLY